MRYDAPTKEQPDVPGKCYSSRFSSAPEVLPVICGSLVCDVWIPGVPRIRCPIVPHNNTQTANTKLRTTCCCCCCCCCCSLINSYRSYKAVVVTGQAPITLERKITWRGKQSIQGWAVMLQWAPTAKKRLKILTSRLKSLILGAIACGITCIVQVLC